MEGSEIMSSISGNFGICALLNIEGLDIQSVVKINDDLSVLYSSIEEFLALAPLISREINDKEVLLKKELLKSKLEQLDSLFENIGAQALQSKMIEIDKAINRHSTIERNTLISELEKMVVKLKESLEESQIITKAAKAEREKTRDSNEKLSYVISKVLKNEVPNILIVDDVPLVLSNAISILNKDYVVHGLPRGSMVNKLLKNTKIDLFILDIEMPGMDGYTLFSEIRKMPLYKNTPILFFTSHVSLEYLKQANDLGASGFIKKPVEPEVLLEKVKMNL